MGYLAIPPAGASGMDGGLWGATARAFLQSKVASLTDFEYQRVGQYNFGSTGMSGMTGNDATAAGAGKAAAAGAAFQGFGISIVQAAKTVVFGVYGRAAFQAPTAAKVARWGLCTSAGTARITLGTDNATSATNFYRQVEGTTADAGVAHTAGYHNVAITSDATNISFWIDGVSAGAIACSTLTADESLWIGIAGTDALSVRFTQFVWGGISP